MKILFVDNSSDLEQNWIHPLRKKGWGVVRARSAEDAARMTILHGEGLEAIAVTEKFVPWAEKQDIPFIVLLTQWKQNDVLKHQNSNHAAVSYLPFASHVDEVYALFDKKESARSLKSTGTDALSLEEFTQVLSKPEPTRTSSGLYLAASEIVLGGKAAVLEKSVAPASPAVREVEAVSFDDNDEGLNTVLLDRTKLHFDPNETSTAESLPELEEIHEIESHSFAIDDSPPTRLAMSPLTRADLNSPPMTQASPLHARSMPVSNQFSIDPSPSSQVSDVGTLKSYLALREQDVAVLGGQVRSSQERIQQLEALLKVEKARSAELAHIVSRQESQLKNYDQEKQVEFEVLEKHIEDIDSQLRDRTDKVRTIEAKLRLTVEEVNKVKDRVRVDIRRIRVREKELEGQLEILKKDSSSLLQSRDDKIIELKRKLDLLEFNMELVQEQYSKERKTSDELKGRLKDAASVMKQAGGLLEQ